MVVMRHNEQATTKSSQAGASVATDSRHEFVSFLLLEGSSIEKALKNIHDEALYFNREPIYDDTKEDLYKVMDLRDRLASFRKEVSNG